jgi:hypothetical protein
MNNLRAAVISALSSARGLRMAHAKRRRALRGVQVGLCNEARIVFHGAPVHLDRWRGVYGDSGEFALRQSKIATSLGQDVLKSVASWVSVSA